MMTRTFFLASAGVMAISSGIVQRIDALTGEVDHFTRCATCGQAFDMRDLEAVIHHEQPGHEPVPGSA